MPLVRIDILEGRPPEVIEELHSRVASLVGGVVNAWLFLIKVPAAPGPQADVAPGRGTQP